VRPHRIPGFAFFESIARSTSALIRRAAPSEAFVWPFCADAEEAADAEPDPVLRFSGLHGSLSAA